MSSRLQRCALVAVVSVLATLVASGSATAAEPPRQPEGAAGLADRRAVNTLVELLAELRGLVGSQDPGSRVDEARIDLVLKKLIGPDLLLHSPWHRASTTRTALRDLDDDRIAIDALIASIERGGKHGAGAQVHLDRLLNRQFSDLLEVIRARTNPQTQPRGMFPDHNALLRLLQWERHLRDEAPAVERDAAVQHVSTFLHEAAALIRDARGPGDDVLLKAVDAEWEQLVVKEAEEFRVASDAAIRRAAEVIREALQQASEVARLAARNPGDGSHAPDSRDAIAALERAVEDMEASALLARLAAEDLNAASRAGQPDPDEAVSPGLDAATAVPPIEEKPHAPAPPIAEKLPGLPGLTCSSTPLSLSTSSRCTWPEVDSAVARTGLDGTCVAGSDHVDPVLCPEGGSLGLTGTDAAGICTPDVVATVESPGDPICPTTAPGPVSLQPRLVDATRPPGDVRAEHTPGPEPVPAPEPPPAPEAPLVVRAEDEEPAVVEASELVVDPKEPTLTWATRAVVRAAPDHPPPAGDDLAMRAAPQKVMPPTQRVITSIAAFQMTEHTALG